MKEVLGTLRRNEIGRWEIEDCEFSSGSSFEISLGGNWTKGFLEHNGRDYYFYTAKEGAVIQLKVGMKARILYNY